jgi:hypothetical protein
MMIAAAAKLCGLDVSMFGNTHSFAVPQPRVAELGPPPRAGVSIRK